MCRPCSCPCHTVCMVSPSRSRDFVSLSSPFPWFEKRGGTIARSLSRVRSFCGGRQRQIRSDQMVSLWGPSRGETTTHRLLFHRWVYQREKGREMSMTVRVEFKVFITLVFFCGDARCIYLFIPYILHVTKVKCPVSPQDTSVWEWVLG